MKDDTVSSLLVASMIALVQSNEDNLLRHTNVISLKISFDLKFLKNSSFFDWLQTI